MLPPVDRIAALLPQYTDTGDTTRIITNNGEILSSPHRLQAVLRKLSAAQSVDLATLRRNVGRATGQALHRPLPLTAKALLIPVKVRKPKIAGDNCTGYLNYYSVNTILAREADCRYATVELSSGSKVDVLWSVKTVKACMNNARLASHEVGRTNAQPELRKLERKLIEIIYEILASRQND